mgnify:CR=1 FL=1
MWDIFFFIVIIQFARNAGTGMSELLGPALNVLIAYVVSLIFLDFCYDLICYIRFPSQYTESSPITPLVLGKQYIGLLLPELIF